jgi:hypothetical protein
MLQSGSTPGTPLLGFDAWGASLRTILVDAARPVAYFGNDTSAQRLSLHFPRQSLVSHLGFQP